MDPGAGDAKLPVAGLSPLKRQLLETYVNRGAENAAATARIPPRPPEAPAPLSFAQQQVWVHAQMAGDTPFYNETVTIYRQGPLHVEVLERCLLEIIRRHEIWRTTFDTVDGEPVQIVHRAPCEFPLQVHDLRHLPEAERKAKAELVATEDARRPFDLKEGPLLRALVVRMEEDRYRLYMTVHQIVFDAVTAYRVFLPELAALYEAFSTGNPSPLAGVGVQYADFAYWQRKGNNLRPEHTAYWRQHLAGELPQLEWPSDRPRPPLETHRGRIQRF